MLQINCNGVLAACVYFFSPPPPDLACLALQELAGLFTAAAHEVDPATLDVTVPDVSGRLIESLASAARRPDGDGEVLVVPLVIHDTLALATTRSRPGPADAPLAPHEPAALVEHSSRRYLGRLVAHAAEAPADAPDCALSAAAARLADLRGLGPDRATALVPGGAVIVAIPGPRAPHDLHAAFAYRKGSPVEPFFQSGLLELALYHLKTRSLDRDVRTYDLPDARKFDAGIRDLIHGPHPARLGLAGLLDQNDKLTTLRAELVTAILTTEHRLHTLAIARRNFERTAADHLPDPAARAVFLARLVDAWAVRLREDCEAELVYRRGARERATIHFESLQATVDAQEAGETHRLAKVMAALTAAQVAGVVPALFSDKLRESRFESPEQSFIFMLIIFIVFSVLLYLVIWFIFLRRAAVPAPRPGPTAARRT